MTRTIKKPTLRKAEIISSARELFQNIEYEKVTMQMVMDTLGIAKGTIYHYFKSKEALFETVIKDIVDSHNEYMQTIMSNSEGSALEKIKILASMGNMASDSQPLLNQLHRKGNDTLHTRVLAAALIQQAQLYEQVIKQGCDEGTFKTEFPLECAELILAGIQFLTDVGIYPWTPDSLNRRFHAFPRLIEQQLQAPRGSFNFLKKMQTKIT